MLVTRRLLVTPRTTGSAPYTYAEKIAYLTGQGTLVRTFGDFDASHLTGAVGDDYGYFVNGGGPTSAVIEDGWMKFIVSSLSGAGGSGQFFSNFSANRLAQYGPGQTVVVQWRQIFHRYMFEHHFLDGGGWKLIIIGAGDPVTCTTSSTATCQGSHSGIENVMQNTFQRGVPQGYSELNQSGPLTAWEVPFPTGTDIKYQNAYGPEYCRYPLVNTDPVAAGCFTFASGLASPGDQVTRPATITIKMTIGSLSSGSWINNNLKTYWSWEGDSAVQLHDIDYTMNPDPGTLIGKFWLLPYHTGKDATEVHDETFVKYKDVIIATGDIPLETRAA